MHVKLTKNQDVNAANRILYDMGIKNRFITDNDTRQWLDDINNNPKSPQRHLKPDDRDLTIKELRNIFPIFTETGLFYTDLYYGRTPVDQMQKIAQFIVEHPAMIEYITKVDTLIDRGDIPVQYHEILRGKEKPYEEPEMLPPEEQQTQDDLHSGHLLCRSWSSKPFWVIFGKVEKPRFLKTQIYKDDLYNTLYRDKNGYAYLLMPLYDFTPGFPQKIFDEAWDMGLRENLFYFMAYVYRLGFNNTTIAETLARDYNAKELADRIERMMDLFKVYGSCLSYDVRGKKFTCASMRLESERERMNMINLLAKVLQQKEPARLAAVVNKYRQKKLVC